MIHKNLFKKLTAVAAGMVLFGGVALAQTDVTLTITRNGGDVRTLHFGVNPAATNGIDTALGEQSLPPMPPTGVYEARFTPDPDGMSAVLAGTEGSPSDFHPSTSSSQLDTHWVKIQPGTGGTPVVLTWSTSTVSSQYGAATLTFGATTINMRTTGTATITSASQAGDVRIFTGSPTVAPSGITSSPCPLAFGTVQPSTVTNRALTLTNQGAGTINLDSIRINNANYSVVPSVDGTTFTTTQAVNVRLTAPASDGAQNGTITIYFRDASGAHTQTCAATGVVSSGEGLYFVGGEDIDSVRDNNGGYTKNIGLRYSGATPAQGVQFDITVPNNLVRITGITLGSAISNPGNWTFDYETDNAVSGSEIRVLLYGNDTTVNLPANTDDLFVLHLEVDNIQNCSGGLGGDDSSAIMTLGNVQSALATSLGESAGIGLDPNRDTQMFFIANSSARGDVNCDDNVDILDLLMVNDHILGRLTLAPWQINRADLAGWSSYWATPNSFFNDANNYGDGVVNVQDLVLLTNAILNEKWPDADPLSKIEMLDGGIGAAPGGAMSKVSGIYDVKFIYEVSNGGIKVDMENKVGVKGYQMKLKAVDAPEDLAIKFNSDIENDFQISRLVVDGEIRIVAYSKSGEPIMPMNDNLMEMPFSISNPNVVAVIEPITVGGPNNEKLKVEYQVISKVATVNGEEAAKVLALENMPNPFNGNTTIRYTLPTAEVVTLVVSDATGKVMARLVDGTRQSEGQHAVEFDAAGLPNGTYFYTITAGSLSTTSRMVLAR